MFFFNKRETRPAQEGARELAARCGGPVDVSARAYRPLVAFGLPGLSSPGFLLISAQQNISPSIPDDSATQSALQSAPAHSTSYS